MHPLTTGHKETSGGVDSVRTRVTKGQRERQTERQREGERERERERAREGGRKCEAVAFEQVGSWLALITQKQCPLSTPDARSHFAM